VTVRFTILPKRPYSLALTAERYTRFPEVVDRFDGDVYRRLLPLGSGGVLLTVAQEGPPARAALAIRLDGARAGSEGARIAARRVVETALGAATDIAPFYRAHRSDPVLGDPIRAFRGLRVAGAPSLWEALVTAVLAQQVNLRFAYDIRRELSLAYGRRARFGGEEYVAFPSPESLAKEGLPRLRRFRLSRSKAVAIRGLARAFDGGTLAEESLSALSDEEAIARLTALRGVGRWTAEIGLLRGLGRTDIFPAGDLGVVKYLAQGLLGRRAKAKEDDMRRFAERWQPHRGLALVYGYAELNRRKTAPSPPSPRPALRRDPESARAVTRTRAAVTARRRFGSKRGPGAPDGVTGALRRRDRVRRPRPPGAGRR
jgi:DNA-3-methyladenine glycosylase II